MHACMYINGQVECVCLHKSEVLHVVILMFMRVLCRWFAVGAAVADENVNLAMSLVRGIPEVLGSIRLQRLAKTFCTDSPLSRVFVVRLRGL